MATHRQSFAENAIPPPPSQAVPPSPTSPGFSSSVLNRRHSRKRSSQVIVPPIPEKPAGTRRRSDRSDREDSTDNGDDDKRRYSLDEETDNDKDGPVTMDSVVFGASMLIVAQFFAKIVTSTLNQLVLNRYVDPAQLGAVSQLEFIINTILFFSREAIRLASQRQSISGKKRSAYHFEGNVVAETQSGTIQEVINMGYVSIVVGIVLTPIISLVYTSFEPLRIPNSQVAVLIFASSAIVELTSEPCFLLSLVELQFKVRASIESAAVAARCLTTFMFVIMSASKDQDMIIIAFALGQFAYSATYALLFARYGILSSRLEQYSLRLQAIWRFSRDNAYYYFNPDIRRLALSIALQSVFKYLLSEGDKLVTTMLPLASQGVYALVGNYGSLLARLVFLPIEEASRNSFSQILSANHTSSDVLSSVTLLSGVLRAYFYLGIFALVFGPLTAPFMLRLLVSPMWLETDAPRVLAAYACYIPFLAFNGILEAFVQSVATVHDIKRQSQAMVFFFLSFAASDYVFLAVLDLGASGLVYANMINMALRIVWCSQFVSKYYAQQHVSGVDAWNWLRFSTPGTGVAAMTAFVAACAWYLGPVSTFDDLLRQVGLAIALLMAIGWQERSLIIARLRFRRFSSASTPAKKD